MSCPCANAVVIGTLASFTLHSESAITCIHSSPGITSMGVSGPGWPCICPSQHACVGSSEGWSKGVLCNSACPHSFSTLLTWEACDSPRRKQSGFPGHQLPPLLASMGHSLSLRTVHPSLHVGQSIPRWQCHPRVFGSQKPVMTPNLLQAVRCCILG